VSAQSERARPIAQVLADRVDGEMEERRKELGRYPLSSCRFEAPRKAIALLLMKTPAAIQQRFERTSLIIAGHVRAPSEGLECRTLISN
jgi:hypothetical protein